ncbi:MULTISPECIES: VOC family protein [unclassified Rhodococcus (in: high G+C Gram-positive bacteria)]|uniref:VOC family protein n=1 Tax=unclassified Rhodococcus (in: high G+C Gram-positive bacteria) TaxID=192944 RepID=UPI002078DA28|nr:MULTISPECIES: VOC family protein [unclassified Rhodococcus (in: high G+C Gram-positive bacteria)]
MTSRIAIAVDCRESGSLAQFWCAALGYPSTRRWTDAYGREYAEASAPGSTSLLLQVVDDRKPGKNRPHLDIAPSSGSRDDEVRRCSPSARTG